MRMFAIYLWMCKWLGAPHTFYSHSANVTPLSEKADTLTLCSGWAERSSAISLSSCAVQPAEASYRPVCHPVSPPQGEHGLIRRLHGQTGSHCAASCQNLWRDPEWWASSTTSLFVHAEKNSDGVVQFWCVVAISELPFLKENLTCPLKCPINRGTLVDNYLPKLHWGGWCRTLFELSYK